MKTAISVPDVVFQEAERLAQRLAKSRSQLYTEALVEYLSRHDPDSVTERLDEVFSALGEPKEEDHFVRETSRRILERVEW
jgi:metal-responsive CopG/Arc/MetJ family transcriptional regulator